MKLRKVLTVSAVVLAGLAALLYVNRLYLLKYSLGWYTDILYPREADQPLAQRPPNIIAPGTQYQQPISNIDILPTVVARWYLPRHAG